MPHGEMLATEKIRQIRSHNHLSTRLNGDRGDVTVFGIVCHESNELPISRYRCFRKVKLNLVD